MRLGPVVSLINCEHVFTTTKVLEERVPSTHNDRHSVPAEQLLFRHPIMLVPPLVKLLDEVRSNIWLGSLRLEPSFHALITEGNHAHPVLYPPEAGQESKCQSNRPNSVIERTEDSECRTLLHNGAVPCFRLHHTKVLIEGKFAH